MAGNLGIGTWIERRARVEPDRVALVLGETRRTYAELAGRVRRLAHQLRALGVKRTDRVGWLGPNHPAFLECLFATAKIGAVLAPINHRLERSAVEAICAASIRGSCSWTRRSPMSGFRRRKRRLCVSDRGTGGTASTSD